MKLGDVIRQMLAVLPKHSTYFSDAISITSLVSVGGVVTVTTPAAHGLATNDTISITGSFVKTPISSLTFASGIATAITSSPHDLTLGFHTSVSIIGSNQAEYNGSHGLLSVPNRNKFTFSVTGTPVTPATGTIYVLEDKLYGYNGRHQITVTSPTTFTYPAQVTDGSAGGTPLLHKGVRVSGALTPDRAVESYTQQATDKAWAFVVPGENLVSRDRSSLSDMDVNLTPSSSRKIREIETVSVMVFIPTADSIAAINEYDKVEDITISLYRTLAGLILPSYLYEQRRTMLVPLRARVFAYAKAYYIHLFEYQTSRDITLNDMVSAIDSVAFRDIQLQSRNDFGVNITNTHINLDEVP